MEVKIGIQHSPREIVIDVDGSQEEIEAKVSAAVSGGTLSLADVKGRLVLIPGDRITYVELGKAGSGTVGFR